MIEKIEKPKFFKAKKGKLNSSTFVAICFAVCTFISMLGTFVSHILVRAEIEQQRMQQRQITEMMEKASPALAELTDTVYKLNKAHNASMTTIIDLTKRLENVESMVRDMDATIQTHRVPTTLPSSE